MKIDIQSTDVVLDESTHEHIHRKLKLALSRMEPFIETISVHLSNVADSSNGNNKQCCLKISLTHKPDIIIEDIQTDLPYVIDRAIQKASRIINRKLEVGK